jgi:hypothetical protein
MTSWKTRDPGKDFAEPEEKTEELIRALAEQSSKVLVKKLATNDRQWAIRDESTGRWLSNQAGPLLPAEARTSGFFPELTPDPDRPWNQSATVEVYWPAIGKVYTSRFTWYSDKGDAEHHFTTNPRQEFAELSPASYLLMFAPKERGDRYRALTVDAADEVLVDYISEVFGIGSEFHCRVYEAGALDLRPRRTALQQVVVDLVGALTTSPSAFEAYVKTLKRRSTEEISRAAYEQWKAETGHAALDPFSLDCPGDVIHDLTRVREFALYRLDEAKEYGADLVRAIAGNNGRPVGLADVVAACVERFDQLYAVFMRAKQARSSRVGGTFETHIKCALGAGGIPCAPQFIFDGNRPDFVLPSGDVYADEAQRARLALVLTLKTTLRERWKQVVSESTGCPIFLGTLDETVPGKTLDKLNAHNIVLVVPERFKSSEYAEYKSRANVVTYRAFFDELKSSRSAAWLQAGIDCFGLTRAVAPTQPTR